MNPLQRLGVLGALAGSIALPLPARAQDASREETACVRGAAGIEAIEGPAFDARRTAEVAGAGAASLPGIFRRGSDRERTCDANAKRPRVVALPVHSGIAWRTTFPVDRNNGAAWEGRGGFAMVRGGASFRWGVFSAAVDPILYYERNEPYPVAVRRIPGYSEEAPQQYSGFLDLPVRPEDGPIWRADPGQSYARVDAFGAKLGVSTENVWWGTGSRTSIALGNTAPGFPHVFAGTSGPVRTPIGPFAAEMFWGRLHESDAFDFDAGNDVRLLAGASASVAPRWVGGLEIGASRILMTSWPRAGFGVADALLVPYGRTHPLNGDVSGIDAQHRMLSLHARWVFPESGFEVYGERVWLSRRLGTGELPDSAGTDGRAWLAGASKVFGSDPRFVRVYAELMNTGNRIDPVTELTSASFYIDPSLRQGYTHRGQMLGAFGGPGSDSQTLGVQVYYARGSSGAYVERVAYAEDVYYDRYARIFGFAGHDVSAELALRQTVRIGGLELGGELSTMQRRNRAFSYLGRSGLEAPRIERSWRAGVDVVWYPQ